LHEKEQEEEREWMGCREDLLCMHSVARIYEKEYCHITCASNQESSGVLVLLFAMMPMNFIDAAFNQGAFPRDTVIAYLFNN
jgi:hypothetical protein